MNYYKIEFIYDPHIEVWCLPHGIDFAEDALTEKTAVGYAENTAFNQNWLNNCSAVLSWEIK